MFFRCRANRDERPSQGRSYKDEFENWQGQFKPRGAERREVEGASSEEVETKPKPNPTSSSNPDFGKF